jgi:predicted PurR-regulated permease PerM
MFEDGYDRLRNLLFYGAVLCLAYFVFRIFEPFFVPLAWAAILAVVCSPLRDRLENRHTPTRSALMITGGVILLLIVPALLVATLFVREGISAARGIQAAVGQGNFGWLGRGWSRAAAFAAAEGLTVDLPTLVRQYASRVGESMAGGLEAVVRNLVLFFFELVVMLFSLFYFVRDGQGMLRRFRLLLPFSGTMQDRMLAEARGLIFASLATSLTIGAAQGLICGASFALVGIHSAVFWGVVMGFMALLPVVGAWPIWGAAAIWLFSTGHLARALTLIAICGGVGAAFDNILRPILLGGRASLNGLLVFISVVGGIAFFGVLGIVLGPIVVATALGILDVYSGKDEARTVQTVPP